MKALELVAGSECIALRADALMFAGKYKKAYTLFREYEKVTKETHDEWALKSWILGGLIKNLGIEAQKRRPIDAMKAADTTAVLTQEVEKGIAEALALDALCGLAWFNNGVRMVSNNQYRNAMISFLIAAIVQPNDMEAWSNAIICNFNCPEFIHLLPSVISVAYEKNGEKVFSKFAIDIDKQPHLSEERKAEIVNFMGMYMGSLSKKEKLPILRLIKPDGTYVVIDSNLKPKKDQLEKMLFPGFPEMSFSGARTKDKVDSFLS